MFKDYYVILNVSISASEQVIKNAFKREAIKWHPDKNPGKDTNIQMQNINEAYLILKDSEARRRYDIEYSRFTARHANKHYHKPKEESSKSTTANNEGAFTVEDELLKKWMKNAKRQSVDLAKATLDDLIGMIKIGTKVAMKETVNYTMYYILFTAIIFAIVFLFRTCKN